MKTALVSIPTVLLSLVVVGCSGDEAGTNKDAATADPTASGPAGSNSSPTGVGEPPPGGTPGGSVAPPVVNGPTGSMGTPTQPGPTGGDTAGPGPLPPGSGSGTTPSGVPTPQGTGGTVVTPAGGSGPVPVAGNGPVGAGGNPPVVTGGAGGMGTVEPEVPEPVLVTSGQGAYWVVGDVTMGGSNANFTVNSSQQFQEWHGWGGTFNEAGWVALQSLSEADRQRALTLLFDEDEGIGFDWGRIPIGPSDYAIDRYHLSDAPGQFSIARDQMYLIPYIHAAQQVKDDVKYWGSPWTPPPYMKSGTTENMGYDKGYFNTEYYEEYAEFFVKWIQAYEAEGIPIDSVMPQNEPGWAQSYPTCAWGPATDSTNNTELPNPVTLGTFVDGHLFPALDAAGLDTKVWMGTLSNGDYFDDYWNDMASKPSFSRIVGGALQWENEIHVDTVLATGKLVMQSEHKCGNYPWLSARANSAADANRDNFLANMAPNNHAYGEESWDLMKQWIDDGVNIYSAWNMVLDQYGWNLDEVRPWPQNAMLVATDSGELQVTAYYYVFRHIAQYVDVGAHRVGINGNALAFKNPDGSIVAIMFNEGTSPSATTLSIDGTMVQFEIPARGWATVNWQG